MKKIFLLSLTVWLLFGCPSDDDNKSTEPNTNEEWLADPPAEAALFENLTLSPSIKNYGSHNPVMSQWFGADPWAMVYNNRVYLYMTDDNYGSIGNMADPSFTASGNNGYNNCRSIRVISSPDLVNWTDHGLIRAAGSGGIAPWASQAFAPAAAWKNIDGKDWFFLYIGNNANGVYVLKGDKPTPDGNWTSPYNDVFLNRSNSLNPTDCFDPAVLIDDDGTAYLYFGGGIAQGSTPEQRPIANPDTARVVRLKSDMISCDGDVRKIEKVPYLLEDFGINKIFGRYYYSYCSSSYHPDGGTSINYGISDSPIGPFFENILKWPLGTGETNTVDSKLLMKNPSSFGFRWSNNHHAVFEFKGKYYIAYHTVALEDARAVRLGYAVNSQAPDGKQGYRSTNIDRINFATDGTIVPVTMTMEGVPQTGKFYPYELNKASTIGAAGGWVTTLANSKATEGISVQGIKTGGWIALYGVDFGSKGASKFACRVTVPASDKAVIEIRDGIDGDAFGYVVFGAGDAAPGAFFDVEAGLLKRVKGVKDVVFVFYGEGWEFDWWQFVP